MAIASISSEGVEAHEMSAERGEQGCMLRYCARNAATRWIDDDVEGDEILVMCPDHFEVISESLTWRLSGDSLTMVAEGKMTRWRNGTEERYRRTKSALTIPQSRGLRLTGSLRDARSDVALQG